MIDYTTVPAEGEPIARNEVPYGGWHALPEGGAVQRDHDSEASR